MNVVGIEIAGTQEECRKVSSCTEWFWVILGQWPWGILFWFSYILYDCVLCKPYWNSVLCACLKSGIPCW